MDVYVPKHEVWLNAVAEYYNQDLDQMYYITGTKESCLEQKRVIHGLALLLTHSNFCSSRTAGYEMFLDSHFLNLA